MAYFKPGDRVRFKTLEEMKGKVFFAWVPSMDYLAGKKAVVDNVEPAGEKHQRITLDGIEWNEDGKWSISEEMLVKI